jgi:acetyl-CoA carboxylase alpha subunit
MMKSSRCAVVLLALAAWLGIGAGVARSQQPAPEPLSKPLAEKLRAPLIQFLRDVGVPDPDGYVASTKAASLGGQPELIAFRLETAATCHDGICLTIIGSIEGGTIGSQAMFFAPKVVSQGDAALAFLGSNGRPPILFSESADVRNPGHAVSALQTPKGWIILAR